ncbi:hypothetical protein STEG23_032189 [Scotinomys teguina]
MWDDCKQLLGILNTTEERNKILENAWDLVSGPMGTPLADPTLVTASFLSTRPNWDYSTTEDKDSLRIYHQALLASLKATAHQPTNMDKIYDVKQGAEESPAVYLERLVTAFKQYSSYNPESEEAQQAVVLAYVNQVAPDIRKKLQPLERLGEKSLRDLVVVAEKVYNKRETEDQKEEKKKKSGNRG